MCLKRSALHWLIYCFDLNELQESTTHLAVLCSVRLLQLKYKIRCLHKQELFITMCALEPQAERNGRLICVIMRSKRGNAMNIYYEVHGNGYPIILLHGNQENRKIYDQLVKDLENDYQLIAMDSRYHGKSIKSGPLTLDRMAQDVMDVANELDLEAYDVIGFSDGANIALTLAGKDERLKHMVLLSPNATPKGIKWYYRLHMYMTLLLLPIFCIYDKRSRIRFKLISFMTKEPHFTADYLTELKIPALLLSGENDVIKDSDFTFIQSSLPYCVHKVIKNSPHFLLGDQYDKTLREIRGFLYACHHEA